MNRFTRFILSQFVWVMTIGILLFFGDEMIYYNANPFLNIFIMIGIALLLNLGIWFGEGLLRAFRDDLYETSQNDQPQSATNTPEKRKRDHIDHVLRDLSNEDLFVLRQRLQEGSIDDELLYERMVADDGEIINMERIR